MRRNAIRRTWRRFMSARARSEVDDAQIEERRDDHTNRKPAPNEGAQHGLAHALRTLDAMFVNQMHRTNPNSP